MSETVPSQRNCGSAVECVHHNGMYSEHIRLLSSQWIDTVPQMWTWVCALTHSSRNKSSIICFDHWASWPTLMVIESPLSVSKGTQTLDLQISAVFFLFSILKSLCLSPGMLTSVTSCFAPGERWGDHLYEECEQCKKCLKGWVCPVTMSCVLRLIGRGSRLEGAEKGQGDLLSLQMCLDWSFLLVLPV